MAKIGNPDATTLVRGTHVHELRYTVPGVFAPGNTERDKRFASSAGGPQSTSTFFWNVIAPSWNNVIQRVRVRVTLPTAVTGAQCTVGVGLGVKCPVLAVSGRTPELTASYLAPRTPVTLRAGVDVPALLVGRRRHPQNRDWARIVFASRRIPPSTVDRLG